MVVISGREGMVLEMSEEDGELCPLYVEAAPVKLVVNRGKRVWDAVELAGKLGVLIFKAMVPIYLGDRSGVVEAAGLFDEGMESSIASGEDGEEPWSCCLGNGGLSIVRPEEKLCDIGGFPRLSPGQ
jgi:hypothetical protein